MVDMESVTSAILSGAAIAAVVTGIVNLIIWGLNRKAKLQDDKTIKDDMKEKNTLEEIKKNQEDLMKKLSSLQSSYNNSVELSKNCFRILFSASIRDIATKAIAKQEITLAQKETIHELHNAYHNDCGGNGFFDQLMKDVDDLPVR